MRWAYDKQANKRSRRDSGLWPRTQICFAHASQISIEALPLWRPLRLRSGSCHPDDMGELLPQTPSGSNPSTPGRLSQRSRIVPFPFCQITLKAEKPLKDRYTKSFYRMKLKNIGAELSKKRLKLGISRKGLAQQIGVRLETIQNWEHRRSIPDICYLLRIIDFLGYDPFGDAIV